MVNHTLVENGGRATRTVDIEEHTVDITDVKEESSGEKSTTVLYDAKEEALEDAAYDSEVLFCVCL